MDWNCLLTEDRLTDFFDGVLSREQAQAFSAHCARCARCRQLVTQVSGLLSHMRGLEPVEVPPQLVAKILYLTIGHRASRQGWRRRFAWVPRMGEPQFAMGVVTVAASFLIVFQAVGAGPNNVRRANLNAVSMLRTVNRQVHLSYARGAKFVNDLRVVREIESRLQSVPAPPSEPSPALAPEPSPEPKLQPGSSGRRQKSQNSRPGRDNVHRRMLASLLERSWYGSLADGTTWSSR
jgi:hypothetical protein